MSKNDIIDGLERLINKEITIAGKISYSSNHVDSHSGSRGILRSYSVGEDHEDVIALVDVILVTGRKAEIRRTEGIWMDARDILEIAKPKARK